MTLKKATPLVGIVDYAMGNIFSVENALRKLSCNIILSHDPSKLLDADFLLLPGVGSFSDGMKNLNTFNLIDFLIEFIGTGKPLLGICLGMQLLFEVGREGGDTQGLGLFKGTVEKLVPNRECKVPHIGWNEVRCDPPIPIPLFTDIPDGASFYFIHSYHVIPSHDVNCAYTDFCSQQIVACVNKDNIFGVQFHPEKSQKYGMRLLQNFLDLKC